MLRGLGQGKFMCLQKESVWRGPDCLKEGKPEFRRQRLGKQTYRNLSCFLISQPARSPGPRERLSMEHSALGRDLPGFTHSPVHSSADIYGVSPVCEAVPGTVVNRTRPSLVMVVSVDGRA